MEHFPTDSHPPAVDAGPGVGEGGVPWVGLGKHQGVIDFLCIYIFMLVFCEKWNIIWLETANKFVS